MSLLLNSSGQYTVQCSGTNFTPEAKALVKGSGRSVPNIHVGLLWWKKIGAPREKPRQKHRIKCTLCTEKPHLALVGFKPSTVLNS